MAVQIVGSDFPSLASDQAGVNKPAAPDRHDIEYKARRRTLASDQLGLASDLIQHGQNGPQRSAYRPGHDPEPTCGIDITHPDPVLDALKAGGVRMGGRAAPENSISKLSAQNRGHKDAAPPHDSMHAANDGPRSGGAPNVPGKIEGAQSSQGAPVRQPK